MNLIYNLCASVSLGILIGFGCGALKMKMGPAPTDTQQHIKQTWLKGIARFLKYLTCMVLLLGMVWTVYYLILGCLQPGQAEYASAMSQLIVSVLTVVSIIFAFFQFLQNK